eukprot:3640030-Pleurochrysis_carterae.AAC.2
MRTLDTVPARRQYNNRLTERGMVTSPTVVTQGNRESTTAGAQRTAELLHARFNHRRAEVLRLLPQCTRDAPRSSWATIARNFAWLRRML